MKITPLDINNQQFRVKFRGFDIREVDSFLEAVAAALEEQIKENTQLKEKVAYLESNLEVMKGEKEELEKTKKENDYEEIEGQQSALIAQAKISAEEVLNSAKIEAGKLKEQIEHMKRVKKEIETYFESFLKFNIELLNTWEKTLGEKEEPE